ncbi:hypothetical protein A1O3_04711 [Capronia epimyces CBS 606.96]|uniref:Uncharacterized protein n=1 Tax=Capronia epimyces CBS 606.96 TaxID=1182542 RepID=W9YP52_9EURO|nr:uncharacterized protein A1O3_04711 [Capronia epimyces CBS 606.96]EXJ84044.1 hypothetical protein A1O3_04711 [Capronia epimyces CBS 606.96]
MKIDSTTEEPIPAPMTIAELKEIASAKLPPAVRDYYNGGAMDMITYDHDPDPITHHMPQSKGKGW